MECSRHKVCRAKLIADFGCRFLAVKLHMESLSSKTNIAALKKAITRLPNTLDQLYQDALHRIESLNEDDREIAQNALRWVAYVYEPLTVPMLEEALAIDPEGEDFDPEAAPPITLVLNACEGLLIVDEETQIVRLVHYTAQDYFNALIRSNNQDEHARIAGDCITFLSYTHVQSLCGGRWREFLHQRNARIFTSTNCHLTPYASRF